VRRRLGECTYALPVVQAGSSVAALFRRGSLFRQD
jgi:hypothetical protein